MFHIHTASIYETLYLYAAASMLVVQLFNALMLKFAPACIYSQVLQLSADHKSRNLYNKVVRRCGWVGYYAFVALVVVLFSAFFLYLGWHVALGLGLAGGVFLLPQQVRGILRVKKEAEEFQHNFHLQDAIDLGLN